MQEPSHHSGQTCFVGKLIREDRAQAGLSLNQYAALVGVSRPYLSWLERGEHNHPSPDVLLRIAKARSIQLSDLFLAAGYVVTVPSPVSCARALHPDWPDGAFAELTAFYNYLLHKFGSQRRDS